MTDKEMEERFNYLMRLSYILEQNENDMLTDKQKEIGWFKKLLGYKNIGTFGMQCKDLPFVVPKGVKSYKIKFRSEDYPVVYLKYDNGDFESKYPDVKKGLLGYYLVADSKGGIDKNKRGK